MEHIPKSRQPLGPSVFLRELHDEAQALLNLKSLFGRLPDSKVKTVAIKTIEDWFETAVAAERHKSSEDPSTISDIGPGVGDDDIPF